MKKSGSDAQLIKGAANDINTAIARTKETFNRRDTSAQAYADWQEACRATSQSIEQFYDSVFRFLKSEPPDKADRAFALRYVDLNPRFFGSGYLMDRVLTRFKQLDLTTTETNALQRAVLGAIDKNVGRGFRRYCRLIPRIADSGFINAILQRTTASDGATRSRARMAAAYFRHI